MKNIRHYLAILLALALLCVASVSYGQEKEIAELIAEGETPTSVRDKLTAAIIENLKFCKRRLDKTDVIAPSCKRAPGGCEKRINLLVEYTIEAAREYDLDPYFLAAVLFNESRFNPWAVGGIGERGVAQLHPRSKRGKRSKFVRSAWYRKKCEKIPGNCQADIIMAAADHIRSAIDKCEGKQNLGISMYNTGKCKPRWKYIRRVNFWYNAFMEGRRAKTLRWCDAKKRKKNRFLRRKKRK